MMKNSFVSLCLLFALFSGSWAQKWNPAIPRDTSFTIYSTYLKFKKAYPDVQAVRPVVPDGVTASYNLVYTTLENTLYGKRELHADLFRPGKAGRYPAVIFVYGGAWISGSKENQVPLAQQIAARGFVTLAVEYQLLPEAPYPAAVYNLKAAIRWLRANAEQFSIDPDQIAISGSSAGGQLAALVGLTGDVVQFEGDHGYPEYSSSVQAIIDMDGVIDFMAPLSLNNRRNPESPDVRWLGGDFYQRPDRWKEASPIFWANENSPPVLFLTSPHPRFTAGMNELTGMMDHWGIYYEKYTLDCKYHAFWLMHPWFDDTVGYLANFLTKVFKTGQN